MKDFELEIYNKICDMVYQYSGIRFDEKKADFVFRRLDDRIEFTGASGLKDYYQTLRFDTTYSELRNLVEILTTNETYFFREYPQLQSFAEFVLPEVLALKRKKMTAGLISGLLAAQPGKNLIPWQLSYER
jgi:chemotaxis protein methyltransferase CheR